mgnify:CR=1 FL=1
MKQIEKTGPPEEYRSYLKIFLFYRIFHQAHRDEIDRLEKKPKILAKLNEEITAICEIGMSSTAKNVKDVLALDG